MPMLEIRLFGNPAVTVDGQAPSPDLGKKELWLLACLALQEGKEVSREALASRLWPETDESQARFYLRKSLSRLRHAFGSFSERLLSPTAKTLRLDFSGEEVFCDLLAFDRASTPAERAAFYSGPLLQGCFDDWILPEREKRESLVEKASPVVASNLPTPLTELLGREREQEELAYLIRRARLITLLGPGGSGKTRLSLAVAEAAQDAFVDGVWFVDLSSLTEGAAVDSAALKALNLTEGPSQTPREALLDGLATKNLLLILDNAEHVLDATASLALALLTRCPRLKVLVTSRQALSLNGEQVYPVSPLALPPTEALEEKDPYALLDFSALRLLVERATQASPAFRLTRSNAESAGEVCRLLDGMPLAIEMAATRVRYQPMGEIAAQLGERLDILAAGNQAVPERQRSLEAAIGWSYNLLSAEERAAFRAVSAFHGGWTSGMAESILPGSSACLPSLVEKSLAAFHPGGDEDEPRYSMLQTLQQFAVSKSRELGERESLQRRHLEYFSGRSEESRERLVGPKLLEELDWLERELDNIRAALRFGSESSEEADQHSALALAGNLRRFWYTRHYMTEASLWYERLLSLPGCQEVTAAQGLCQLGAGLCAQFRDEPAAALTYFEICQKRQEEIGNHANQAQAYNSMSGVYAHWGEEALAVAASRKALCHAYRSGDLNQVAHTGINLGITYISAERTDRALRHLQRGLVAARRQGNLQLTSVAMGALAELHWRRDEVKEACELGRSNVDFCRKVGRNHALAIALNYLGLFLASAREYDEARGCHVESLLLAQQLSIRIHCLATLEYIADFERQIGRFERTTTIRAATAALHNPGEKIAHRLDESFELLRERLGGEAFEAAITEGAAMSLDEVIALAVAP